MAKRDIIRIMRECEAQRAELEREILATPTGEVRDLLTAANIFMMTAHEKMTLEQALVTTVKHALKEADKVFAQYERDNPDD